MPSGENPPLTFFKKLENFQKRKNLTKNASSCGRLIIYELIDFGCATEKREIYNKMAGTPEYFPPEWYSHRQYSSDGLTVFSLGAIMYILLTGTWQFEAGSHKRDFLAERHLSNISKSLLDSVLCPFPSKRVPLSKILEHNFF